MKKKLFIFIVTVLLFTLTLVRLASASTIIFKNIPQSLARGEQFAIDVLVDPEGTTINGIEGTIDYSADTLTLVRIEDGVSIFSVWIPPKPSETVLGTVSFSGIVPGGFGGAIDPFDREKLLPGNVLRLVFEAKKSGEAFIDNKGVIVTKNDGKGTQEKIFDATSFFGVSNEYKQTTYVPSDTLNPDLVATIVQDENLFSGKWTLVFNAGDKESGIQKVEVREGVSSWQRAESPYLLKDQSRTKEVEVKATDLSGNTKSVLIPPLHQVTPFSRALSVLIALALLLVLSLALSIFKRHYAKKETL